MPQSRAGQMHTAGGEVVLVNEELRLLSSYSVAPSCKHPLHRPPTAGAVNRETESERKSEIKKKEKTHFISGMMLY